MQRNKTKQKTIDGCYGYPDFKKNLYNFQDIANLPVRYYIHDLKWSGAIEQNYNVFMHLHQIAKTMPASKIVCLIMHLQGLKFDGVLLNFHCMYSNKTGMPKVGLFPFFFFRLLSAFN